jgi:hypothetical protein
MRTAFSTAAALVADTAAACVHCSPRSVLHCTMYSRSGASRGC